MSDAATDDGGAGNLFDAVGGRNVVNKAIDMLYTRIMHDYTINHFFANADMDLQRLKQKAFMSFAFGGAPNYTGAKLRDAHADMVEKQGLDDKHFDVFIGHIEDVLAELDVDDDAIDQVLDILEGLRDHVLNR
jgi:hemoglobin